MSSLGIKTSDWKNMTSGVLIGESIQELIFLGGVAGGAAVGAGGAAVGAGTGGIASIGVSALFPGLAPVGIIGFPIIGSALGALGVTSEAGFTAGIQLLNDGIYAGIGFGVGRLMGSTGHQLPIIPNVLQGVQTAETYRDAMITNVVVKTLELPLTVLLPPAAIFIGATEPLQTFALSFMGANAGRVFRGEFK